MDNKQDAQVYGAGALGREDAVTLLRSEIEWARNVNPTHVSAVMLTVDEAETILKLLKVAI